MPNANDWGMTRLFKLKKIFNVRALANGIQLIDEECKTSNEANKSGPVRPLFSSLKVIQVSAILIIIIGRRMISIRTRMIVIINYVCKNSKRMIDLYICKKK